MVKVFEKPEKYLQGPLADHYGKQENWVVVGAGMAGLMSASMLLRIGHNVTLVEKSHRPGGRIETHYGDGWFADLGAMRYPIKDHVIINSVFGMFKIKTVPFTNTHETKESYLWLNQNYYSVESLGYYTQNKYKSLENEEKLMEIYDLFTIATHVRDRHGKLLPPHYILHKEILYKKSDYEYCHDDVSLKTYLKKNLERMKLDMNFIQLWSILDFLKAFMNYSVHEFATNSPLKQSSKTNEAQKARKQADEADLESEYVEVANGSEVITKALWKSLVSYEKAFKYFFNASVTEVNHISKNGTGKVDVDFDVDDRITLKFNNTETGETSMLDFEKDFDYAILTPTARVIREMNITPHIPFDKKIALDALSYFGSVKIFLKFSRPFWAEENEIKPIYYNSTIHKNGGSAVSDDLLKLTYYPSNDIHGPTILASYVWESESDYWLAKSDEDCILKCKDLLARRHGNVVHETFQEGKVKKWSLDENSAAGFVIWGTLERGMLMDKLRQHHGRILFAGEYTNKILFKLKHVPWINLEGSRAKKAEAVKAAAESAIRSLIWHWPHHYKKLLGKDEEEEFQNVTRRLFGKIKNFGSK